MSFWYDFSLACNLKPDTPQQVIDTLAYMTRTAAYVFDDPPDHPYFQSENWRTVLQGEGAPSSFAGDFRCFFRSTIVTHFPEAYISSIRRYYHHTLNIRRCMHDDEFAESAWWELVAWLALYSKTVGFVGYFCTESDSTPTLIYFRHGAAYCQKIEEKPEPITEGAPDW